MFGFSKDMLEEYQTLTNFATKDHITIFTHQQQAVDAIDPDTEYTQDFATKYKWVVYIIV